MIWFSNTELRMQFVILITSFPFYAIAFYETQLMRRSIAFGGEMPYTNNYTQIAIAFLL